MIDPSIRRETSPGFSPTSTTQPKLASKATSRPRAEVPHTDTIDRLKAIANQSADSLFLSDGPPQPDWKLLDLAAEILSRAKQTRDLETAYDEMLTNAVASGVTQEERDDRMALLEQRQASEKYIKPLLVRARKLPATTPAGIFAKVLIVRSSKSGAASLAMNLADELVRCEALRQSIWPASVGGEA